MKFTKGILSSFVTTSVILCLECSAIALAQSSDGTSAESRAQSQAQAHPEVEKQRQDAEQQARRTIDKEAAAAIDETQKAIKAIADGKADEAIAAIERATGKINVLTARSPATALLPVDAEVEVIESAPLDVKAIKQRADAAEEAVESRDFPAARVLLAGLISEIRVRTYHLPLATYPTALRGAARLLDQKNTQEASAVLTRAMNTLVIIDRVMPLPIVFAQAAVAEAQAQSQSDKSRALTLLVTARNELERANELGYAGRDPEYDALRKSIDELERQLKGDQDSGLAFSKVKEKLMSFFKRQSQTDKKSDAST